MTHIFLYLLVEHRTMTSRAEFCNSSNLVRKADLTRVDVPSEPLDSPLFASNPSHSSIRRQHGWKRASSWNTLKFSFSLLFFFAISSYQLNIFLRHSCPLSINVRTRNLYEGTLEFLTDLFHQSWFSSSSWSIKQVELSKKIHHNCMFNILFLIFTFGFLTMLLYLEAISMSRIIFENSSVFILKPIL